MLKMRSVLVDHARSKATDKRGGAALRFSIDEADARIDGTSESMLALDEALTKLHDSEPDLSHVAELRLFGGLDHGEIARSLGVSTRTVERAWKSARDHLRREQGAGNGDTSA